MSCSVAFINTHRDMTQPRPGVGRASGNSLPLVVRPTPCAHRLRMTQAMRSAPSGLSPADGASFEPAFATKLRRAGARARRSRASRHSSKPPRAACHVSCYPPHAETKGILCVRSSKTPHTCGCLPALRVPSIRRIMMVFCSGVPRRALKGASLSVPVGP
jgi:hypothetical protein